MTKPSIKPIVQWRQNEGCNRRPENRNQKESKNTDQFQKDHDQDQEKRQDEDVFLTHLFQLIPAFLFGCRGRR